MKTRLVVDSSAICALFFEDETKPESEQLLERLEAGGGFWVPALFLWEVANVLLMAERRRRISPADRAEALQLVASLGLQIDQADAAVVWHDGLQLAAQTGLTSTDAAYLELAMRLGAPLASRDRALQECCRSMGVKLQPC